MSPELTSKAWAQIRYDYEHTDRPIEDICAEHGISSGTLRDRTRRWGWTRRRTPIPLEGPPPAPAPASRQAVPAFPSVAQAEPGAPSALPFETATPSLPAAPRIEIAAGLLHAASEDPPPDPAAIVPRLQSAVARVLPAIESIVMKLGTEPTHPREMERAARVLVALTRTLRELNNLLGQRQAAAANDSADDDDMPEDIDAFRRELARRIRVFVASRTGQAVSELTAGETPATCP